MPIRTRSGSKYKEWMLEKIVQIPEDVLERNYENDDSNFSYFGASLWGMVMRSFEMFKTYDALRSFEMFKTYDALWLHIKCICTNFDLPSPYVQSSTSPDPRIRLLDDLGLTSDLPLQQRPWIADLYMCNTDLLYDALPKLINWPKEIDDENIDDVWKIFEVRDEMSDSDDMSDSDIEYDEEEGPFGECSICKKTCTEWELNLKDQILKNGQWVGPHCIGCDFELFCNGTSSRFTPEWHARGFNVDEPITIINGT
jgi:hypothetical protein